MQQPFASLRRSFALVLLAPLALSACAAPGADSSAPRRDSIVDGTRELGEEAVVLVSIYGGIGRCTGTLITPRVVLTAKHCVQQEGSARPYSPGVFTIGFGNRVGATRNVRVSRVYTTPGSYTASATTGLGGALVGVDIGVLVLATAQTDVTPIPVRRDAPTDRTGQPYTAIGFGQTPSGESGVKYTTTSTIESIRGRVIYSSQTICSGDSGGPMIQETPVRRVIGVASFGVADSCPSAQDGHNRVDVEMDLIDRAIIEAGDCVDLGEEICDSLDNDCDGEIDETCTPLGSPCTEDAECAFGQLPTSLAPLSNPSLCADTTAGRICTRPCLPGGDSCSTIEHPFAEGSTRWDGASCVVGDGCQGLCQPAVRGALANGTACSAATDCVSLHCADPGDGIARCLDACLGDAGSCPVGEVCTAGVGGCGACFAAELVSSTRGLGEPCGADAECGSTLCDATDASPFCTRSCSGGDDSACGVGFHCVSERCARGNRSAVGGSCRLNDDCVSGAFCATRGATSWCTEMCTADTDCPSGFACVDAGARICAPVESYYGEACAVSDDCAAGDCIDGRCTESCLGNAECPAGLLCRRSSDGLSATCVSPAPPAAPPADSGGCSVGRAHSGASHSGASSVWFAIAALLGVAWSSRRRARRR